MPLDELARVTRSYLASLSDREDRSLAEGQVLDWLYGLIRHHVKRGRLWNLPDVLSEGRADCLGYCKLFEKLTKDFGLNGGVIEVIQDNRGRYVPHTVYLVNFSNGQRRLVDPWYGSANIRHRLMTARVSKAGSFETANMTMRKLESATDVSGLSSDHICGIGFYILANSLLERGMKAEAIDAYEISLWLHPSNVRALFNRAVAMESMGEEERAKEAYQRLFSIPQVFPRLLATVEDIEPLIELDEKGLDDVDQQAYLLRMGFITGHKETWKEIGRRLNSTPSKLRKRWKLILEELGEG